MILFLSLMYKTMGGGSWTGLWADQTPVIPQPKVTLELEPLQQIKIDQVFGKEEEVDALSSHFSLAWHSLKHVSLLCGLLTESYWKRVLSGQNSCRNY